MSVTITYPIDPLQIDQLIDDGWTDLTLWYANTPDGTYADTSATSTAGTLATMQTDGLTSTTFVYSSGTPAQWFKVVPYNGSNYANISDSSPFHGGGGTTLATLSQRLGDELRDLRVGTLTTSTTTTSALTATPDIVRFGNDYLNNWFLNNTTRSAYQQITDWAVSAGTGTATLASAITSQASGDAIEITRRWTPDEYRRAINWAIVSAYPILNKTIVNTGLVTAVNIFTFDVPQDIKSVYSVEIESGFNISSTDPATRGHPWRDVPFKIIRDGLRQQIELDQFYTPARRLRVIGTGPMSQLLNDSDYVEEIEPQLDILIYYAAFHLYRGLMEDSAASDMDRYSGLADHYWQLAAQLRDSYMQSRPPKRIWSAETRDTMGWSGRIGSWNPSA